MNASSRRLEVAFFGLLLITALTAQKLASDEGTYTEISEDVCPDYITNPLPECVQEGLHQHQKNCSWFYSCDKENDEACYTRKFFTCNGERVFCNIAKLCIFPAYSSYKCDKYNAIKTAPTQVVNIYGQNVVSIGSLPENSVGPLFFLTNGLSATNETTILANLQNIMSSKNNSSLEFFPINESSPDDMVSLDKTEASPHHCNITENHKHITTVTYPQTTIYLTIKLSSVGSNSSSSDTENEISTLSPSIVISNSTLISTLNLTHISQIIKCKSKQSVCKIYDACETIDGDRFQVTLCPNFTITCENIFVKLLVCGKDGFYNLAKNQCVKQLCPTKGVESYIEHVPTTPPVTNNHTTKGPQTTPTSMLPSSEDTTQAQKITDGAHTFHPMTTIQSSTFGQDEMTELKTTSMIPETSQTTSKTTFTTSKITLVTSEVPHHVINYTSPSPDYMKSTELAEILNSTTTTKSTSQVAVTEEPEEESACYLSLSKCHDYETCIDNEMEKRLYYLCSDAYYACPNERKTKVCQDSEKFDPNKMRCIIPTCTLIPIGVITDMSSTNSPLIDNQLTSSSSPITESSTSGYESYSQSTVKTTDLPTTEEQKEEKITDAMEISAKPDTTSSTTTTLSIHHELTSTEKQTEPTVTKLSSTTIKTSTPPTTTTLSTTTEIESSSSASNLDKQHTTVELVTTQSTNAQTEISTTDTTPIPENIDSSGKNVSHIISCEFIHEHCRVYKTCETFNAAMNDTYLCREAYSLCKPSNKNIKICKMGEMYNPKNKKCVSMLCPIKQTDAINVENGLSHVNISNEVTSTVISITGSPDLSSTQATEMPSTNIASTENIINHTSEQTSSNSSVITNIVTTTHTITCTIYYRYCRNYTICVNDENSSSSLYMCKEAFSRCQNTEAKISACNGSDEYNPAMKVCVSNRCPIKYTNAVIVQTSSKPLDIVGQNSSVIVQIIDVEQSKNGSSSIDGLTGDGNLTPVSIVTSVTCKIYHNSCKYYTICQTDNKIYLCLEAFSECGPSKKKNNLCNEKERYNPDMNKCVTNICPLEYVEAQHGHTTIIQQSINQSLTNNISVISGGQVTNVGSAGVGIISEMVTCTFTYRYCRLYKTCGTFNSTNKDMYLCREAFSDCGSIIGKINACKDNELYYFDKKICISKTCPLEYIDALIVHTTIAQGGSIPNKNGSESTQVHGTTATSVDEQMPTTGAPGGAVFTTVTCIFFHKYCKWYITCDNNGKQQETYLCQESFSECGPTKMKIYACKSDYMYDPFIKACVHELCPLKHTVAVIIQIMTIQENSHIQNISTVSEIPSIDESVNPSNTSVEQITVTETSQGNITVSTIVSCIFYHKYCKTYTICDDNDTEKDLYLCRESFSECGPTKQKINACQQDDMYNPVKKVCVQEVCPLKYTDAIIVQTTTIQVVSNQGENISTIAEVTDTDTVGSISISEQTSHGGINVSVTVSCVFYHKYCKFYDTCDANGTEKDVYLCLQSFSECGPTKQKINACQDDMYDPVEKVCVQEMCPLEYTDAIIIHTTLLPGSISQSQNMSSIIETGDIDETRITITVSCIFHYKYCKEYDACDDDDDGDDDGEDDDDDTKKSLYLCREAFSECGPTKHKINACKDDNLYDPIQKSCITEICPLEYTSAIILQFATIQVETNESKNISTINETPDTDSDDLLIDGQTSQGGITVTTTISCIFYYKYCKDYDACDESETKKEIYLCRESFSECGAIKQKIDACKDDSMYDPVKKVCVSELCPLEYINAIIVQTTTLQGVSVQTDNTSKITELVGSVSIDGQNSTEGTDISTTVSCIFYYKYCKTYDTCNEEGIKSEAYLCRESFSECGSTKQKIDACKEDSMYDPVKEVCVTELCPLEYIDAVIIQTTTLQGLSSQSANTSKITETTDTEAVDSVSIGGQTSTGGTNISNIVSCIFYYKYCKAYDSCDDEGEKSDTYLCRESFSECGPTKEKIDACKKDSMYDPVKKVCVSELCPLEYIDAIIVKITSIQGVSSQSENTSNIIEIGDSVSSVSIDGQTSTEGANISTTVSCTFYYKYCKDYDACDDSETEKEVYLCRESFSECGLTKQKIEACKDDDMYDPIKEVCVHEICPLEFTDAVIVQTTIIQGDISQSEMTSTATAITGIDTIVDSGETSDGGFNITTTVSCIFYHKYCKTYDTCDERGMKMDVYLCHESFSECGITKQKIDACKEDNMYDPNKRTCVHELCPIEYTDAVIVQTIILQGVSNQSQTTSIITDATNTGTSSSISVGGETAGTEISHGETNGISTVSCTLHYKYCKTFDSCDDAGMRKNLYLCRESFSECGSINQKINVCKDNNMYDPVKKVCVHEICPLEYTNAVIVQTTIIQIISNQNASITTEVNNIGIHSNTSLITDESPTEVVNSQENVNSTLVTCIFFYKYCRMYSTCDHMGVKKDVYMCQESYSECGSTRKKVDACSEDDMFDPAVKACIIERCPLEYTDAIIIQTVTQESSGSGSVQENISSTTTTHDNASISVDNVTGAINSSTSSISTVTVTCTFFYAYCRQYEVCVNDVSDKKQLYLCRDAFSECGQSRKKVNACKNDDMFSLEMRSCVSNLCPLTYIDAIIVEETTISLDSITASNSSTVVSSITSSLLQSKNETSIDTVGISVSCRSHYHLCKEYDTCMPDIPPKIVYLCKVSFTECEHYKKKINSCRNTDLFDPQKKLCYSSVCPVKTYDALLGGAISNLNFISSNNSIDKITSIPSTSVISESVGEKITCFLSYSSCREYDVCIGGKENNGKLYLCEKAFSECMTGTIKKTACASSHLYDPESKRCISSLCALTHYNASLLDINSFEVFSLVSGFSVESGYMSELILGGNITVIESAKKPNMQTETYVTQQLGIFDCQLRYHSCKFLKTCEPIKREESTLLCKKIISKCSGQETFHKVCPESYYFNPVTKKCVFPTCSYKEKTISIYFNSTIHVEITIKNIYSEKITTLEDDFSNEIITSDNLATISNDCFLSYKFCRNYSSCLTGGANKLIYICKEAYEECPSHDKKTNLCSTSVMYSPKDNKCVSLLCPLMLTETMAGHTTNKVLNTTIVVTTSQQVSTTSGVASGESYTNDLINNTIPLELLPTLPVFTRNKTSILEDNKGLSHSLSIFCQYRFEKCNYIRICDASNKKPHDKVFCQATENCYFRNQTISSNDVCSGEELYDIRKNKCANITEEMSNCPGSGILRELVSAANLFQTETNKVDGHVSTKYDLRRADNSIGCSEFNLRPDSGTSTDCSKHVICTIGGYIKVFPMKDVCDSYMQCVFHENAWYVTKMSCPTGSYFSYTENQCLPPKLPFNCQFWTKSHLAR